MDRTFGWPVGGPNVSRAEMYAETMYGLFHRAEGGHKSPLLKGVIKLPQGVIRDDNSQKWPKKKASGGFITPAGGGFFTTMQTTIMHIHIHIHVFLHSPLYCILCM